MMRDSRMRLTEFPSQLILGQMREQNRHGIRGRESPLQEVDLGALAFFGKGEDEMRVLFRCGFNCLVDRKGNGGA